MVLLTASIHLGAQPTWWTDEIKTIRQYDGGHLLHIALPLGGIGTGTVSLGGRGQLRDWEIMNTPAKGYSTVTTGNDAPFFAIFTRSVAGDSRTKALLGPVDETEYQHMEGRSVNHHGLPRFRHARFEATYPFGIVHLTDSTMPVKVRLIGYNPLVPGDAEASGIPIAILRYEVQNTSGAPLEVAVCGSMRNFIGKDGQESRTDWKGDFIPTGARDNANTYRKTEEVEGIYMTSQGVDPAHRAWGTIALTTPTDKDVRITYRTSSIPNRWGNALLDFWDDFSEDGMLSERPASGEPDPMASLAVHKNLEAGERAVFTFYVTWHFPNRYAWSDTRVGNYYTTVYNDAWDVIDKSHGRLPGLTEKTLTFVNAMAESTYPGVVKEAALFNISTLRSQTVFRTEDGRMFGWEGVMDRFGSCMGSCTHVWNYEQATAFLFNDLAKTMREVEFEYATDGTGKMSFRTMLPLTNAQKFGKAAADGQMGTIMKFYREWQLSGDRQFLSDHWDKIKSALAFAWIQGGWDADRDGVMEGVQHNTMDVEYFGPNPQMQIWYLGALKAAAAMARAMDDRPFARTCDRLFEQGSAWTDDNLFNGEYYYHKIEVPQSAEDIAPGLMAGMGSKGIDDPDFQLGTGCLVDQLVGQYMAHVTGLGYLVDSSNVQKALESIYKYNKREDMFGHFNNMRSYAMGNESVLLMASWPRGGRPTVPFPYWAEVMTGFEYTAAVGMLYEGMDDKGLEVIRNIRSRYDGRKRNPFDEAECGHHYARAMASWAALLAWSGFQYSGVDRSVQFTDTPGKYFWSNGSAWGLCTIDKNADGRLQATLNVLSGTLALDSFALGAGLRKKFGNTVQLREGESRTIAFGR
jgi:uncharacterized protein (DUF608 family)